MGHFDGNPREDTADFDAYRKMGFQVHLDNPMVNDLAHFVRADVTICSRSTFCQGVAVLNSKCLLFQEAKGLKKPSPATVHIMDFDPHTGEMSQQEHDKLSECLQTQVLTKKRARS